MVEYDHILVQYDDRCANEDSTELFYQLEGESSWTSLVFERGSNDGWRTATLAGDLAGESICFFAESKFEGIVLDSLPTCILAPPEPIRLDLVDNSTTACGPPPQGPTSTDRKEHLYMTETLASDLGLDPANIQLSGPSPQVRVVVGTPKLTSGDTSTAALTVARLCPGSTERKVWVWSLDRLFPDQDVSVADIQLSIHPMAPSLTTVNDDPNPDLHFGEPAHVTPGDKFLHENVTKTTDPRVALLVPHGGNIEINTSLQIDAFVAELEDGVDDVPVNVWENVGKWTGGTYRWHITSDDIHPDGFPGLDDFLAPPLFDPINDQHFQYSVALHGFTDNSDFGIILGGLADRDLRCHVADTIRQVAGSRGDEIGFHIAQAASGGGDLLDTNIRGYTPTPDNLQKLEGKSADNIVNWTSAGPGWSGGIQLEQSTCLRKESDCEHGIEACTADEPDCMHNLVARGVAHAIELVLDDPTVDDGACCTHFAACP